MNPNTSAKAPAWQVRNTATRFENKTMRLQEDMVTLPNGGEMTYAFVERGPAVMIVPVTDAGEVILVRQYRHPVRERCLEIPAGTARDAGELSLEQVAAKELGEEVGGTWRAVEKIGSFFSNSAMSDEECHVFLATGVVLTEAPHREASEDLETLVVPVREAVARLERGELKTGPSALAFFLALPRMREMGLV